MVKKINKYFFIISIFSFFSCQTQQDIHKTLRKKIENFNPKDFPFLEFDKLYVLEGQYATKRDFEIIYPKMEIHRGSDNQKYEDFLIFRNDGTVDSFYDKNIELAKLRISSKKSGYYGVVYTDGNKNFIVTEQAFKGIKRFGISPSYGFYKQEFKLKDKKIYLQEDSKCSVYKLAE